MTAVSKLRHIWICLFLLCGAVYGFCAEDKALEIKLRFSVTNPSESETKTFLIKSYLPKGINLEDVLDKGGFKVEYDFEKSLYYVYQDVMLGPKEKKDFELRIKDIWVIPEAEMRALENHIEEILRLLGGSEYSEAGKTLKEQILKQLEDIKAVQNNTEITVARRMADYEANLARFEEIKKITARLERIAIQAGASPEIAITESSLLGSGLYKSSSGEDQDSRSGKKGKPGSRSLIGSSKGIDFISKSFFRGSAPGSTTTWTIIYIIIGFIAFLSIIFVAFQVQQHKPFMFDKLTGAFTRSYLMERLQSELSNARKKGSKCSLFMMDIDKFKNINDTYGHAAGDIALKDFVITVRQGLRPNDLIGRLGGDEFLVVLPLTDKSMAKECANKIRQLVEKYTVKINDKDLNITTSIGVATYPEDSLVLSEILRKVDAAMYRAKIKGGNSMNTYD